MTDHTGAPEVAGRVPRLTAPQREALIDLGQRDHGWSTSWAPAQKLVALGMATQTIGKWGGATFTITPAGRAALAAMEKQDG